MDYLFSTGSFYCFLLCSGRTAWRGWRNGGGPGATCRVRARCIKKMLRRRSGRRSQRNLNQRLQGRQKARTAHADPMPPASATPATSTIPTVPAALLSAPSQTPQKSRQEILDGYVKGGKVTKVKTGESGIKNKKPKSRRRKLPHSRRIFRLRANAQNRWGRRTIRRKSRRCRTSRLRRASSNRSRLRRAISPTMTCRAI